MEIVIRHIEPSDAEAVHRMFGGERAAAGTLQIPLQSAERWRVLLANPSEHLCSLVASVDGDVVATAGLQLNTRPRRRHVAELAIVVRDDWQGHGVGTALMTALMDLADRWLNVERIELTVFTDNEAAIALYRRFGFEVEGTFRRYAFRDGVYADALAMARLRS